MTTLKNDEVCAPCNGDADMSEFDCADCGVNTSEIDEYYMATDWVWRKYGVPKGMLCVGCLEKRMDRELNRDDFSSAPLNAMVAKGIWPSSDRLFERIKNYEVTDDMILHDDALERGRWLLDD